MIALILLAVVVLPLVAGRALDKVRGEDFAGIVRTTLASIVTLVLACVAMRVVPAGIVPEVFHAGLRALRSA
ncbi:hypothetical protein WKI71_00395 [Streptomyces sp. MS1.AVA.1]|uniref:Uncharacterized protein n=1 Tax=Streptomyces machairae TaxID=3134109 RepID=A0ABU8UF74_9ACTN